LERKRKERERSEEERGGAEEGATRGWGWAAGREGRKGAYYSEVRAGSFARRRGSAGSNEVSMDDVRVVPYYGTL
jgi:hypothetical protein